MGVLRPLYQDSFQPVLFSSPALPVSAEQVGHINNLMETVCSDSQFAAKAVKALMYILTAGNTPVPSISSLTPSEATLGDPSFTLSVKGTHFDSGSEIIWNGSPEPTTRISDTELTTIVNMSTAEVAMAIPVAVQNASGALSNMMTFTLKAAGDQVNPQPSATVTTTRTVTPAPAKK